jgi:ABC-type nitrate/sulfonate/bicarbonate transport system permease component
LRTRVSGRESVDRTTALAIAAVLLILWEVSSRREWIDPFAFPAPSFILRDFPVLWRNGLLSNVFITLQRLFGGLAIGGGAGVLLGMLIGWFPRARRIIDPFVAVFHPIPKIILFPIFIVIFGVNEMSKLAAISLTVFFPTLINTAAGVRQISPLYFEVVRSYGGGTLSLVRHVVLPGSLPTMLSGIRIAANIGLLVTTAIEFAVAAPGIGSIIWISWQTMRIEDLYAGVVTLSLIGLTVNSSINWILRRVAPWQERA